MWPFLRHGVEAVHLSEWQHHSQLLLQGAPFLITALYATCLRFFSVIIVLFGFVFETGFLYVALAVLELAL